MPPASPKDVYVIHYLMVTPTKQKEELFHTVVAHGAHTLFPELQILIKDVKDVFILTLILSIAFH